MVEQSPKILASEEKATTTTTTNSTHVQVWKTKDALDTFKCNIG